MDKENNKRHSTVTEQDITRYLVIDDSQRILKLFQQYDSGLFDVPRVDTPDPDGAHFPLKLTLETAEALLRDRSYKAILLDGNLGLKLEEEYWDGIVVAKRIRSGVYGELNQSKPIFSISDGCEFPRDLSIGTELFKPGDSKDIEEIVEKLNQL